MVKFRNNTIKFILFLNNNINEIVAKDLFVGHNRLIKLV